MIDLHPYILVQLKDGRIIHMDEWQRLYGISGKQIGRYFKYNESRFIKDIEQFGELIINAPLMMIMDSFREEVNRPVKINSYNRTEDYQNNLKSRGFKTAKYSPHVVKMAADIDTYTEDQTREEVKVLKQVSKDLGIPIRVGYKSYLESDQTFIHVDVCPLYYAEGQVFHEDDHPEAWEFTIEW